MLTEKLSHYFPGASFNWTSEGDWSTLEWFGPGDKPSEAEFTALPAVAPVPAFVTRAQAKIALARAGHYEQAATLIQAAGLEATIWWNEAETFRFDHPLVDAMCAELEIDEEAKADLFRAASEIVG